MTSLCSFELLAKTLVPGSIPLPPSVANPYVVQGYFLQVSLPASTGIPAILFDLVFDETTSFTTGAGKNALLAEIIDPGGNVNVYPNTKFYTSSGNGFFGTQIASGQTLIFGIQVLPNFTGPQADTGWHGSVSLNIISGTQGALIVSPTHRQVFYDTAPASGGKPIDGSAYAIQTANGTAIV